MRFTRIATLVTVFAGSVFLPSVAQAQTTLFIPAGIPDAASNFPLPDARAQAISETGIFVNAGDVLTLHASGTASGGPGYLFFDASGVPAGSGNPFSGPRDDGEFPNIVGPPANIYSLIATIVPPGNNDQHLFLLGNYSQGHDVQGKVAAGGDITLTDFSVGAGVPASDLANVLVAGGNLSLVRGGVWGDAWHGGSYSADSTVVFPRSTTVSNGTPVDFMARFAALRNVSSGLANLPANGTATFESWGGLTLRGTDPGANVFQVSANTISHTVLLSIDVPAGSLAVINISGSSVTLRGGHSFGGGIDQRGVLFNFVDATAISATGYGLWGTMLAPYADVIFSQGSFDGGIYAQSLTGNAEGHLNPLYDRDLCFDLGQGQVEYRSMAVP